MDAATRRRVRARAEGRCEYRGLPQSAQPLAAFHVEHVVARQHGGSDHPDNLCLACGRCNRSKGPNLSGVDPATDRIVRLFDPRRQDWSTHFDRLGPLIVGLTPSGRATEERRVQLRAELLANGELRAAEDRPRG